MSTPLIKLTYRQLIDRNSILTFEQQVFEDSYCELLMQAQRYNKNNEWKLFHDLVAHDPKAQSLHYKVGFAIGLYVQELHHLIPGLTDTMGMVNIPFTDYQFSIINSDLTDKKKHRVAITYTSAAMTLLGSVGNCLILSLPSAATTTEDGWLPSFLLPMREELTISGYYVQSPMHLVEKDLGVKAFAGGA